MTTYYTKDKQGIWYTVEYSKTHSNNDFICYMLTPIDEDLHGLSTFVSVFKDESLDNVLIAWDYTKSFTMEDK